MFLSLRSAVRGWTRGVSSLGQPSPGSHPHLFASPTEVCPGIERSELERRRSRLAERIRASSASKKVSGRSSLLTHSRYQHHLVIVPAAQRKYMIDRIPYLFRQDTDFRYLSGCLEPDCALVLAIGPDHHESTLFVRPENAREEKWEGGRTRAGAESQAFFGVRQVLPVSQLESFLAGYRQDTVEFLLWYDYLNPVHDALHQLILDFMHSGQAHGVESPRPDLHALRVVKSAGEVALMRQSCQIAAQSIRQTMAQSRRMQTEAQFFATVDHACRMRGAEYLAYPPVVASGNNANVIHYTQCTQAVADGQMLLMDAGCEYRGYTSDITRTWPVNGAFTRAQRLIYEVVLDVQTKLLQSLEQVGQMSVDGLFAQMQADLGQNLVEIGLIPPTDNQFQLLARVHDFCPHHVSHYLGMDVHDTSLVSKSTLLQPNMIITIEPGVYISDQRNDVPDEFKGIGIRIEDDVLITSSNYEVLSKDCPKTVDDVEETIKRGV
eukprot:maker-scaffold1210_size55525-snap-gene-0.18 protein:Tk07919 transcript:maker-scaffold1210_size55525-snap-gene-0.18-mRNA-1 annotation:"probable xaa-pro aminopeptidase 3 isoform x1"